MKEHLREHIYLDIKPIIEYVEATFHVNYSIPGMTKLLHELNFVYKKPKICPSKANPVEQRKWVGKYRRLRKNADSNDVFYFVDDVHPQHNNMPSYGWIEKGVEVAVLTNSGRQRININGALNIDTHTIEVDISSSVDGESMKRLMDKLMESNPEAKTIYIILDNASYYHSKEVEKYINIAVLTVAPIALAVAREVGYLRFVVLFAMIGGVKAGNVISPNPNTIAAAEKFNLELPNLMAANLVPAIIGLVVTIIVAHLIRQFQQQRNNNLCEEKEEKLNVSELKTALPSFWAAILDPLTAGFTQRLYIRYT